MQKSIAKNINHIKIIKLELTVEWQEKLKKRALLNKRSIKNEIYTILWQALFYEAQSSEDFIHFIDNFIHKKRSTKKLKNKIYA